MHATGTITQVLSILVLTQTSFCRAPMTAIPHLQTTTTLGPLGWVTTARAAVIQGKG